MFLDVFSKIGACDLVQASCEGGVWAKTAWEGGKRIGEWVGGAEWDHSKWCLPGTLERQVE